jgi:hypothetical protein
LIKTLEVELDSVTYNNEQPTSIGFSNKINGSPLEYEYFDSTSQHETSQQKGRQEPKNDMFEKQELNIRNALPFHTPTYTDAQRTDTQT